MKLDRAWDILKQFVEPELQVLGGQEGTAEVWDALHAVEAALKLPPRAPRPRGWVEPPRTVKAAMPVCSTPTCSEPASRKTPVKSAGKTSPKTGKSGKKNTKKAPSKKKK